jgi:hypothetical protein
MAFINNGSMYRFIKISGDVVIGLLIGGKKTPGVYPDDGTRLKRGEIDRIIERYKPVMEKILFHTSASFAIGM